MKSLLLPLLAAGIVLTAPAALRAQSPTPAPSPAPDASASPAASATPGMAPTAAAQASEPPETSAVQTEDEKALIRLEQDWGDAVIKGDVEFVDRSEAEEYVYTDPSGQMSTKHDSLEATRANVGKIDSFRIRDVKVRVYGDTAVLTGQTQLKGKNDDGVVSGDYRWTDVFVKHEGRWQAVASQATAIQQPDDVSN